MTAARRQSLLVGVMLLMLGIAAVWSCGRTREQRDIAALAAADLTTCRSLAAAIDRLREQPAVASSGALGVQEMAMLVERASKQARLTADALEGIFPQAEQRLGNSAYLEKPTLLAIRRVTLEQLVRLLHTLTNETGLTVQSLRVRTPTQAEEADGRRLWDVEATVSYLIYSPRSTTAAN